MSTGAWVAFVAVVVALAFGGYRALTDGRFRGTRRLPTAAGPEGKKEETVTDNVLADTPWQHDLGRSATLLQFSSAFCAPCRATRRVLEQVSGETPGVVHLEVDAEQHLDVVRRLGILRTPTTLVLDPDGREVGRAQGAARRDQVVAALAAAGVTGA